MAFVDDAYSQHSNIPFIVIDNTLNKKIVERRFFPCAMIKNPNFCANRNAALPRALYGDPVFFLSEVYHHAKLLGHQPSLIIIVNTEPVLSSLNKQ